MTKTRIGWMANMHKKYIRKKTNKFSTVNPLKAKPTKKPKTMKQNNEIQENRTFPKQNVNSTLLMIKLMDNDALWTW